MRAGKAIPVPSDIFVVTDVTSWGYESYGDLLPTDMQNKIVVYWTKMFCNDENVSYAERHYTPLDVVYRLQSAYQGGFTWHCC
jgi:hypothetical protein